MAGAGEARSVAGDASGEATPVTFTAASEHWERNKNGKRLRSEISESSSAAGDWRSRMERTMRQQAREVAQLHQTVDKMARLVEANAVCEETQWLGMRKRMQDRERKWDARHRDDGLWGTGISVMATKILAGAGARAGEREAEAGSGLQASKHADTTQRKRTQALERQRRQAEPRPEQQQKQPKPTPTQV